MGGASPLHLGVQATTARRGLEESPTSAELKALFQFVPEMLCIAGGDGYFKRVNPAFEKVLGYTTSELLARPFIELVHPDDRDKTQAVLEDLTQGIPAIEFENRYRCRDGSYRWLSWQAMSGDRGDGIYAVAADVTQRKEAERRDRFTGALLAMFSEKDSRKEYLDAIVEIIRDWTGCACVGIRGVDAEGRIPYGAHTGFSREFVTLENWLSLKDSDCACTRVISGRPEPQDSALMTPGGSFRSERVIELDVRHSPDEPCRFRETCIRAGFGSLAIVPIRYREEIVGAIHIADHREDMAPLGSIEFIESMTPLIGEAMHRFDVEEKVESQLRAQIVLGNILHISLERASLEEQLQYTLDLLFSLPWLRLQSKGAPTRT